MSVRMQWLATLGFVVGGILLLMAPAPGDGSRASVERHAAVRVVAE